MLFLVLFLGSSSALAETVERQTSLGTVVGKAVDGPVPYQAFLGVPYAQPPLNELRFLPPLPLEQWEGRTVKALEAPPACPQLDGENVVGDEDCLQLSVFTPATALCAESEVRKAVERSSYAVALKFRVFFLLLKSVKF